MAIFTVLSHPSDLSRADGLSYSNIEISDFSRVGDLSSFSSSEIISTGTYYYEYRYSRTFEAVLEGNFERTAEGAISGPVDSYEVKVNGNTFFLISSINEDATDLWPSLLGPVGFFDLFLAGDDKLLGISKADELWAGDGNDLLRGFSGTDDLYGQNGDDRLFGGRGKDDLNGGNGNDFLDGGRKRDLLWGVEGDDTLTGGNGKDRLDGGQGNDVLSGGKGNDVFIFGNYSSLGEFSGDDVVTDFHEGDVLRFRYLPSEGAPAVTLEQIESDVLISVYGGSTILVLGSDSGTVSDALIF